MLKHHTFKLLLASLLAAFIVSPAVAQRGIVVVPIKDKAGNQVGLYKESHALVIGVSDYTEGWPKLPGVKEDVRLVRETLEQAGFNVVVKQDPSSDELDKTFKDFINQYGHNPDTRLLFYFAGHGHTLKLGYGGEMGYIVPADAPNPNMDRDGFLAKALDMQMIEVYARRIQSKHALFMFDSCFSGSLFVLTRAIPEVIQAKTALPVRQFITAGTANQTVPDESIFRQMFVKALKGDGDFNRDGYVTATELGQFLENRVTNYSGRSQTPKYGKIRDPILDQGDFVFPLKTASFTPKPSTIPAPPSAVILQGHLQINVNASNSQITVNGENRGTATPGRPLNLQNLPTGSMSVRVDAEGFDSMQKTVTINRNEWTQEVFELSRTKVASLPPPTPPKAKSSGNCPNKMSFIPRGVYLAGKVHSLKDMSINALCVDHYEVTQAEYERVIGKNPSKFKGANHPVEKVTWYEAKAYCKKVGKRLPTEWEWEKAAKAGTSTKYYWGHDPSSAYAWYGEDWERGHHPVGQKEPNTFGLYDMSGNVWEWTGDDSDTEKFLRGGSWNNSPSKVRSAYRYGSHPAVRYDDLGFRCAQ